MKLKNHGAAGKNSPLPLAGEGAGERAKDTLLDNAKSLRSNQTDAEQRLWYHLRAHRFMSLEFKRQKPLGRSIVDFVCMERRLIVELDGGQHAKRVNYDKNRDEWLCRQGYTVLRFLNNDVMQNLEGVSEQIRSALTLSPTPLPQVGEGIKDDVSNMEHHDGSPLPPAGEGLGERVDSRRSGDE